MARAVVRSPQDVFSPTEQTLVLRFAAEIGMEYGEIDVLRDRHSGLIYAVDANRTPLGGPALRTLAPDDVFRPLASSLAALLERWQPR